MSYLITVSGMFLQTQGKITRISLKNARDWYLLNTDRHWTHLTGAILRQTSIKVQSHLLAKCPLSSVSFSAKIYNLRYVIMDAFRHVRYRDVLFPDTNRMTLIRHWHGTDTALTCVNGPLLCIFSIFIWCTQLKKHSVQELALLPSSGRNMKHTLLRTS
jgi:hypothetical protein